MSLQWHFQLLAGQSFREYKILVRIQICSMCYRERFGFVLCMYSSSLIVSMFSLILCVVLCDYWDSSGLRGRSSPQHHSLWPVDQSSHLPTGSVHYHVWVRCGCKHDAIVSQFKPRGSVYVCR